MTLLGVLLAGALGAPARYLVERGAQRAGRQFPWGTLLVNVTGSLALGVVVGLAVAHGLSPTARTVVGTGFLGAYTTFSTYVYEIVRRLEAGQASVAVWYLLATVATGTATAAVGLALSGGL